MSVLPRNIIYKLLLKFDVEIDTIWKVGKRNGYISLIIL